METFSVQTASISHGYPRPQLVRVGWTSLNGRWQFAIDPEASIQHPKNVDFGTTEIVVPYAPETKASGIENTGFYKAVWYRRELKAPVIKYGERLILHFGAVDSHARVWVNDQFAVEHDGGYTPSQRTSPTICRRIIRW